LPVVDAVSADYQGQVTFLAVAGRSSPEASADRVGDWFSPDRLLWGYSDELWALFGIPGQPVSVQQRLGEDVTNKKTNAANKSDAEACRWVALSALRALQDGARSRGANAVVDIVSYYKKNEFKSSTNYECYAGTILAGVALKGTYAKVK